MVKGTKRTALLLMFLSSQGERKRITLEVEKLVTATAANEEQGIAGGGGSPSPKEPTPVDDALGTSP